MIDNSQIQKILIYEDEPFFKGPVEITHEKREYLLPSNGNIQPGSRQDVVNGIFSALNVDEFLFVIGSPYGLNTDDLGKVACIFKDIDIKEDNNQQFEEMVYHTVPISIFFRCFVFNESEYRKFIAHAKQLEAE